MRVLSVIGTRPNVMKLAPVVAAFADKPSIASVLVHTGQHHDAAMLDVFLDELGVHAPDHLLGVGAGTPLQQTAQIVQRLEPVLMAERPDLVVVAGDVTSTLATALAAAKLELPIAHVEAGLRSFDRTMPEELNRIVTDQLSDLLFTHSPEAEENLLREGRPKSSIHAVGNTMIDTLERMRDSIEARGTATRLGLRDGAYLVVTLHRPALVDSPLLEHVITEICALNQQLPVVFPMHPRTLDRLGSTAMLEQAGVAIAPPLGYLDFLSLVSHAAGVLTDSGGIQEETTYLGVPCCTLRDNTERPITIELGTNVLLGLDPKRIADVPEIIGEIRGRPHRVPALWDGHAAERIADVIARFGQAS